MVWVPPRISGVPTAVTQVFQSLSRWLAANVDLTPVGTVVAYAGATAPTGWVFCNGASLLRSAYPDLFTAIGTTWGSLDGTSFLVPDLRGRAPIGAGPGGSLTERTLGSSGGAETHTLTTLEMPLHSHGQVVTTDLGGGTAIRADYDADIVNRGTFPQGVNTDAAGGGNPHNNMPPWAAINYIIKALK